MVRDGCGWGGHPCSLPSASSLENKWMEVAGDRDRVEKDAEAKRHEERQWNFPSMFCCFPCTGVSLVCSLERKTLLHKQTIPESHYCPRNRLTRTRRHGGLPPTLHVVRPALLSQLDVPWREREGGCHCAVQTQMTSCGTDAGKWPWPTYKYQNWKDTKIQAHHLIHLICFHLTAHTARFIQSRPPVTAQMCHILLWLQLSVSLTHLGNSCSFSKYQIQHYLPTLTTKSVLSQVGTLSLWPGYFSTYHDTLWCTICIHLLPTRWQVL